MNRGILYDKEFRPQFSGHETFPLRYGWLKKVFDAVYECECIEKKGETKSLFLSSDSIARFGVGKNMVSSMRHWAAAAEVILEDSEKDVVTSEVARMLLRDDGLDPWMENPSSIWFYHWSIATRSSKAAYIWLFNHNNNPQFDRSLLTKSLLKLCQDNDWKNASQATIKRDVECLVRAYVNKPQKSGDFTEEQIESPLAELGLLQSLNKNETFQIKRGEQPSLSDGMFLYALIDFWKRFTSSARTLTLEALAYEPCSPGRALCLDEDSLADRLYRVESSSGGVLSWSETAGLRQVIAHKPLEEIDALNFFLSDFNHQSAKRAI